MLVYIPGASQDSGYPFKVHSSKLWQVYSKVKNVARERYLNHGATSVYLES